VHAHQDSTFLYTFPKQSCLGLWLALDDATLDNGCLWVRPKSHVEKVRRQFKRNEAYFGQSAIETRSNVPVVVQQQQDDDAIMTKEEQPKFIMESLLPAVAVDDDVVDENPKTSITANDNVVVPSEDMTPKDLLDLGWCPVECKAGDLLVFCGTLDHCSLPNNSDKQRHTFQLHLVEGPNANVTWSKYNWLQYPTDNSFLSLVKS